MKKDIPGFEGLYAADTEGNIYSLLHNGSRRAGKLKPYVNTGGYLRVNLSAADGKQSKHYVHRLVAQTFLPNPKGLPAVNHKDANKKNNALQNLEWCDARHNIAESRRLGLQRKDTPCKVWSEVTGETLIFPTIKKAAFAVTGKTFGFAYLRKRYGQHFNYGTWRIEVMPK